MLGRLGALGKEESSGPKAKPLCGWEGADLVSFFNVFVCLFNG